MMCRNHTGLVLAGSVAECPDQGSITAPLEPRMGRTHRLRQTVCRGSRSPLQQCQQEAPTLPRIMDPRLKGKDGCAFHTPAAGCQAPDLE